MTAVSGSELQGRRVLVVGASAGIGRATVQALAGAGGRVVGAARRLSLLGELSGLAGVVQADVRDPIDCARMVEEAVATLEGLDALVYCPALVALSGLVDTDADVWRAVLETNVVGAALVTRAAIPYLLASAGLVVYLSSDAVSRVQPGLVAYLASKAALDTLLEGWRNEQPDIDFTRLIVGPTFTSAAHGWDPALAAEYLALWEAGRYTRFDRVMQPEEVAGEVVRVLASPVALRDLQVQASVPRRP
jgi:NAD(P)-dependent dehydrogenase (short-subunit alcohol dehydrogenase family)